MNTASPSNGAKNQSAGSHIEFLDGVRGLAASYVVLHHIYYQCFGVTIPAVFLAPLLGLFRFGHLAVDVFIVLSGFCLTIPVAKSKTLKQGTWNFCVKRARRILPTFYAAFVFSAIIVTITHRLRGGAGFPFSPRDLLVNALLIQDLFPRYLEGLNPPFWSVAAEWKIYFFFPVMLWMWRRFGWMTSFAVTAALSIATTIAFVLLRPNATLIHTCPWYLMLFGFGWLAGVYAFHPKLQRSFLQPAALTVVFSLAAILLLTAFPLQPSGKIPFLPVLDSLVGAASAAALVAWKIWFVDEKKSGPFAVLTLKPSVLLGTFGYSIYLIHYPLIELFLELLDKGGIGHGLLQRYLICTFVGFPLILVVSYLFFLLFEKPLLNKRKVPTATKVVFEPAP